MWPEPFPPSNSILHWVLALELLTLLILGVMWLIGLILGRLKDAQDPIGIFVGTFWRELFWPPEIMPTDYVKVAGKGSGGKSSGSYRKSTATEEDEFYGRVPKGRDGKVDATELVVLVIPNSASDAVLGRDGDGLRIQVTGEAGDGKSNKALIELVADAVGLRPYQVTLTKGHYHPRKTVQLQGLSQDELQSKLGEMNEAE